MAASTHYAAVPTARTKLEEPVSPKVRAVHFITHIVPRGLVALNSFTRYCFRVPNFDGGVITNERVWRLSSTRRGAGAPMIFFVVCFV